MKESSMDVDKMNKETIEEFRANEGRVGGMFEGATLLLLHHLGAKSGTERFNRLMCRIEGDSGSSSHPRRAR